MSRPSDEAAVGRRNDAATLAGLAAAPLGTDPIAAPLGAGEIGALEVSDGDDTAEGTAGNDRINARGGDDTLLGFGGDDRLIGGDGLDSLFGGAGDDVMVDRSEDANLFEGGSGGDLVIAGAGSDQIMAGAGRDVVRSGDGDDDIRGDEGNDVITSAGGADLAFGGNGNDVIKAGTENDSIEGGAGNDLLFGGQGNDFIVGGDGNDQLRGNLGDDTIEGGAGLDRIVGGAGSDVVQFRAGFEVDRVLDFTNGTDLLDFSLHSGVTGLGDLAINQVGTATVISDGAGGRVVLQRTNANLIEESDFLFAAEARPGESDGIFKASLAVTFDGLDVKMFTQNAGAPKVSDTDAIAPQTIQSRDLIRLDDLRADARFADVDGSGYTAVILDTGIDLNHPAFGPDRNNDGISDRIVYTQDFSSDGDGTADDVNGHGSNVSSIIGSSDNRFPGVAPGVDIIHLQVLGNNGSGSSSGIERGLQWVVDNAAAYNVVSVNLSLGPPDNVNRQQPSSGGLSDEFAALARQGVITTVAAGNGYEDFQTQGVSSIAADPSVIAVGAVWDSAFGNVGGRQETGADRITFFSQRSTTIDTIFSPGGQITGAGPGGGTVTQSGTSQAAPHIAGLAVLAQQIAEDNLGRRLTPAEFERIIHDSGVQIVDGDDESDTVRNTGATFDRVDALAMAEAIVALGGGNPAPPPNDPPDPTPPPSPRPPRNDVPGDATTAEVFEFAPIGGRIETVGDQDWYAVDLTAGNVYVLHLLGQGSGGLTLSDPLLVLRDADGNVIEQNDDGGAGLQSRMEFVAEESGTFYLSAQGFSQATGTYRLRGREAERNTGEIPEAPNTPSILRPGTTTQGVLEAAGDRDWHRIDLQGGNLYDIALRGLGGRSDALADPLMRIVDRNGNVLLFNDDADGLDSRLTFEATSNQRVYVVAGAFDDRGAGSYAIDVTAEAFDADIPADTGTSATLALGETVSGTLDSIGDEDWYRLDLAAGTYTIQMNGAGGANGLSDPLLRLYDRRGFEVLQDDDGGPGRNAQLDFRVTRADTYYVGADSFAGIGAGDFTLSLRGSAGASDDFGSSSTTAGEITANAIAAGIIETGGDRDWFEFQAEAGHVYAVGLFGAAGESGTPLADPLLRQYDAAGRLLQENDDSFGTRDSYLEFQAADDTIFFFEAAGFGDNQTGDYELAILDFGFFG